MPKLFIIGSGFSKAVSSRMPTVRDLGKEVMSIVQSAYADIGAYERLAEDPEALITYLATAMPWKRPEETLTDRAAFISVTRRIAEYIGECEEQAFREDLPEWATQFVEYLHREAATAVTLNYDTILERLSRKLRADENNSEIHTGDLYRMPLAPWWSRTAGGFASSPQRTYQLLKLHGSINWYFSGDEAVPGEQVYYIPVDSSSPMTDGDRNKDFLDINMLDLVPLIIPPVAEKTPFYRSHLVSTLWRKFRKNVQEAAEIYCVGYSLPKTDLTMRLFLSTAVEPGKTVYIVNSSSDDSLRTSYQETFAGASFDDRYLGHGDAVKHMVDDLLQKSS